MEIVLQGSEIKTVEDFHSQIKNILELPAYYGENLDALWDCLTGWIETPLTLVWKDFDLSKANLGDFASTALIVFKNAEIEVSGFRVEIC